MKECLHSILDNLNQGEMMRKLSVVLILFFMVVESLFIPTLPIHAVDVSDHIKSIDSSFVIRDKDGNVILPDVNGIYTNIPRDSEIELYYSFDILDESESEPIVEYTYAEGDLIVIQLPSQLSYVVPISGLELKDSDTGLTMGILTVASDGTATITLTDFVENNSGMQAWFRINGTFSEDTLNNPNNETIQLNFDGEIIEIGLQEPEAPNVTVSMTKSGVYNYDTNRMVWTVDFTTSGLIYDLEIVDTIGSNHTYVDGSLTLDNNVVIPSLVGNTWTYIFENGVTGNHQFKYETKPNDGVFNNETSSNKQVSFNNSVRAVKDSVEKANSSAVIQTNWIVKSGVRDGSNPLRFNWTITVNSADATLNNAILVDTLPSGLTPVTGSFRLRRPDGSRVEVFSSPTVTPGFYTLEPQGNGTTIIRYPFDGTITDDYALEFVSEVTDPVVIANNSSVSFFNQASLVWDNEGLGTPNDGTSVGTVAGRVITKSVSSNNQNYNYLTNNQSVWTIVLNRNAINVTNARFVDTVPVGSEYVDGSFSVNPSTATGIFSYDSTTREVEYIFDDAVTTQVTITLRTQITDLGLYYNNNQVNVVNRAYFYGDQIRDTVQTSNATKTTYSQMLGKSISTAYNYQTRRMTWRLVINRNQLSQEGVVITDLIPAGMRLLPETIQLSTEEFEYDVNTTVNLDSDLTTKDELELVFNETIDKQIVVTYETIAKEGMLLSDGNKSLTNSARYTSTTIPNLTASATQVIRNTIVNKTGSYLTGSDYIQWGVTINPNAVKLSDVELVDNLQTGLLLDVTTVRLYPLILETNGDLTKVNEPVSETLYTIVYDELNNSFTFRFNNEITQPYRLEFVTDVTQEQLTVQNTISMNGVGQTYNSSANTINVVIAEDDLSGGGTGIKGSVRIRKGDKAESDISLEGAVFGLYNSSGVKLTELTTDENGIATFENLGMRSYTIVELVAPYGYELDSTPIKVRLNSTTPIAMAEHLNDVLTGSITLNKVLLDFNGETISTLNTFEIVLTGPSYPDGQLFNVRPGTPLVVNNLLIGQYTVSEQNSEGYDVNVSGVANITVENLEETVTVTNQEARGMMSIHKDLQYANGSKDSRPQSFKINVKGPSYPDGQEFTINNQTELVLDGLLFGVYEVKEINAYAYFVTIEGNEEISEVNRALNITITNKRRPDSILPKTGLDPFLWPTLFGGLMIILGLVLRRSKKSKNS